MLENRFTTKKYISVQNSFQFDGLDDCIDIPFNKLDNVFSFSIFFNYIEDIPPIATYIFEYGRTPASVDIIQCAILNAGGNERKLFLSIKNTTSLFVIPNKTILPDIWHHLAVTCDGTNVQVYLNTELIANGTTLTPLQISTYKENPNVFLTFASQVEHNDFGNIQLANFTVFNKVLNIAEIQYIHRYVGIIPPTAHNNVILHEPLHVKSFSKKSYLDVISPSTTTAVNQANHGFSIGDCIYNNLGSWTIANGTIDTQYSNPPTIVTNIIDTNNFEYSQEGITTIIGHGFIVESNLYCQSDGSMDYIQTNNFIGKVIDFNTIHIASSIRQGVTSTHSQFNYAKVTPLEEITGRILGKSDNDLGWPDFSTQNSFIDLYDNTVFNPTTLGVESKSNMPSIQKNLKFNNIYTTTKRVIPNITLPNLTDDFSYLVNFTLPAEDIVVVIPTFARFLTLKNTISGYSLEIRYNYFSKNLEFVTGINESFTHFVDRIKIRNTNLSVAITRENGIIVFYLNGYPIANTNTSLDLTGADIVKIGN